MSRPGKRSKSRIPIVILPGLLALPIAGCIGYLSFRVTYDETEIILSGFVLFAAVWTIIQSLIWCFDAEFTKHAADYDKSGRYCSIVFVGLLSVCWLGATPCIAMNYDVFARQLGTEAGMVCGICVGLAGLEWVVSCVLFGLAMRDLWFKRRMKEEERAHKRLVFLV